MQSSMSFNENYENLNDEYKKIDGIELDDNTKKRVIQIIDKIRENDFPNENERGKILERLIVEILEGTKIFRVLQNENTSSNEFDVVVLLNMYGKKLRRDRIIPEWMPDRIIFECKNYKDPVKVDYLGKFYSLMITSKIYLGIFVSKVGVTGKRNKDKKIERYWKDSMAFIHKVNLKHSDSLNSFGLLDLELDDIEIVTKEGSNIIDIIDIRKFQIDTDISNEINEWISPHENEGKIK